MKTALLFLLCSTQLMVNAQSKFKDISTLDSSSVKIKVVMLGADWCTVCRVNETHIENKQFLTEFDPIDVSFFKLNENYTEPIHFNGKVYLYEQTCLNEGTHQLVKELFNKLENSYPTFLFFNAQNQLIASWAGFVNESELESVLNGILNHIDSPDSVKSI